MHSEDSSPDFENRPWGLYQVLDKGAGYKVKRIEVMPGQRLSYQSHEHRAEHWMIVGGRARITLDGAEFIREPGQTVDIPVRAKHRIESIGSERLVFIEIQTGPSLAESDIQRYQDDYGRG